MRGARQVRQAARTVLLVGEGDAEVLFMRHFKSLYVHRYSGVAVTIKNARGMGAAHVVDFAYRQSRNADYDAKLLCWTRALDGMTRRGLSLAKSK